METISPFFMKRCFMQIAGLDVELLGELLHGHAFGERDLAGRLLEVEHLRVRVGLLARVAARGDALRLARSSRSGRTMSGPMSSLMICVPENGPLVSRS